MDRVVIFTENNTRVIKNPKNLDDFKNMPNAFINPDLFKVVGVPPHLWKYDGKEIVPMNEDEKQNRLAHIQAHGVKNDIKAPIIQKAFQDLIKKRAHVAWYICLGLALGIFLGYALFHR